VPSVKMESSSLPISAAQRLRRDALRILARNYEGATLSPAEADSLLVENATLEVGLRAVRRQRRSRQTLRLRLREDLVEGIGTRELRRLVSAVAIAELFLIAVFLFRSGLSVRTLSRLTYLGPLPTLYLIASTLSLIALTWLWRYLGRVSPRSKRGRSSRRS
jgi:hypothetical protein